MNDTNLGERFRMEQREREAFYRNTRTSPAALFRDDAIRAWLEATADALAALQEWQTALEKWRRGRADAPDFDTALGQLRDAGLESWADQGPLDALAEAVAIDN